MSYGLLLLRVVVGLTLAGHGAQKVFGWFGSPGRAVTLGRRRHVLSAHPAR
jgi:putative oxidoreductase